MIGLTFRSFGEEPPVGLRGARLALTWALCFLFVVCSLLLLAFVNLFSMLFGVTINFLGRNGARYTFHHLFGRIPLIGVAIPVLLVYAFWLTIGIHGAFATILPALLTALLAVFLIGGTIAFNRFTRDERD